MKLAIMQPYFFPYIGYWQLLNYVDTFVIYDDVNYIKQGYINRNSILIQGESRYVTLQLSRASSFKKINEIEVGFNQASLIKTIKYNYSRAPFFDLVMPIIEDIINCKSKLLSEYLSYSIKNISDYLNIQTNIVMSSDIKKSQSLSGQEKVLEICGTLSAHEYLNSIGGKALYSKEVFRNHGMDLHFMKTNPIFYRQYGDGFIPNLSVIDVMMFNHPAQIKGYLNSFELC